MQSARYLRRIGYDGPLDATAATLRGLHRAHMLSVPFENLDIGVRPIVIDEAAFVRKVVDEHRGGFCYELNGAFASLLRDIGFDVELLSAGVGRKDGSFGPEFDHLALLVSIDGGQWLADVGFGDSFLDPLRFETGIEQVDDAGLFRIGRAGEFFVVEKSEEGEWRPQYRFTVAKHTLDDFAERCEYHQTSPESSFTQSTICSMATDDGRVTLAGMRLIETRNGVREEREVVADVERDSLLAERFGIRLNF